MSCFSVHWYKENCGDKLFSVDKEDYLVFKPRGRVSFMTSQGETVSKYCPLYMHFRTECLKAYLRYKTIFSNKVGLKAFFYLKQIKCFVLEISRFLFL